MKLGYLWEAIRQNDCVRNAHVVFSRILSLKNLWKFHVSPVLGNWLVTQVNEHWQRIHTPRFAIVQHLLSFLLSTARVRYLDVSAFVVYIVHDGAGIVRQLIRGPVRHEVYSRLSACDA